MTAFDVENAAATLRRDGSPEVVPTDGRPVRVDGLTVAAETRYRVSAGQDLVVPQNSWHRIEVLEPAHLVHVTPGPRSAHRPPL